MLRNIREKCDCFYKLKTKLNCGDNRLCHQCEVQNAAALAKLKAELDAHNAVSSTADKSDDVLHDAACTNSQGNYNMLLRQMHELLAVYKQLVAEVAEIKRMLLVKALGCDTDKLATEVA